MLNKVEYRKHWLLTHQENVKRGRRKHYLTHRKQELLRVQKWRLENPDKWKRIHNVHKQLWKTRRKAAPGSFTKHQWAQLLEIYNWTCPMCHRKEPEIHLSIDHKIPLALGGTNYIDNIQPLCFNCNLKKGIKIWFAHCPIRTLVRA